MKNNYKLLFGDMKLCGNCCITIKNKELVETSRFAFAQSPYLSSRASESNLDGDQEPEHAPEFIPRVLDKCESWCKKNKNCNHRAYNSILVERRQR